MNVDDVLKELETLGTVQNRKVYKRHGYPEPFFGVSYKNLGALKKKIKINHELALELWKTQNADARALAVMVADPAALSTEDADRWARDVSHHTLSGELAGLTYKTPLAKEKGEAWRLDENEWVSRTGWLVLAQIALHDDVLPDHYFEIFLDEIKTGIHQSKNWVRDAMNSTLIAIGARNEALRAKALKVAKAIGKVEVDHGDTGCKTPDAAEYILKTVAHREKKTAASETQPKKKAAGKSKS